MTGRPRGNIIMQVPSTWRGWQTGSRGRSILYARLSYIRARRASIPRWRRPNVSDRPGRTGIPRARSGSSMMRSLLIFVAGVLASASAATAGDVPSPLRTPSQRFGEAAGAEVPSFRRHVLPLAGRTGCSARECHGSFSGQGGFTLSLFGYDFENDH